MQILKLVRWAILSGAALAPSGRHAPNVHSTIAITTGGTPSRATRLWRGGKFLAYLLVHEESDGQQEKKEFNSLFDSVKKVIWQRGVLCRFFEFPCSP
jgi:hypothetical protein